MKFDDIELRRFYKEYKPPTGEILAGHCCICNVESKSLTCSETCENELQGSFKERAVLDVKKKYTGLKPKKDAFKKKNIWLDI